ncbi:MAG: hypothetical protein AAFV80_24380, partial [Bacteroidota bacterium]
LTDGDFVGATDFTGAVGAFTAGLQGYQISDPDGEMVVTFDVVDVTGASNVTLSLDYFIQDTGYESDDNLEIIVVENGSITTTVLSLSDGDLENRGTWETLSFSAAPATTTIQLIVSFDSNSGSEALYLDNLVIEGDVTVSNTVTLTVTDANNATATCTANVTIEDTEAPTAICTDLTVQLDDTGNASITAADVDGGSTDNCGIASISIDRMDFDCTDLGQSLYSGDFDGNINGWITPDPDQTSVGLTDATMASDWGGLFDQYWSYAADGSDRALTLYKGNNTNTMFWVFEFTNTTGSDITSLPITYDMEVPWVRFDNSNLRTAQIDWFAGMTPTALSNTGVSSPVLDNSGVTSSADATRWL